MIKAPASTRRDPRLFSNASPLTSSKMLRLPMRGALGNGLRVATGAVLASSGKLTVISRGAKQKLKPQRDGTTIVTKRRASKRQTGTRIEISFGAALPPDPHALALGEFRREAGQGRQVLCRRVVAILV